MMRDGGVYIVTMVRFSAIPGHVVTAMQSTIGIPFWVYLVAIIITLPKQLVVVYLGVIFEDTGTGKSSSHEKMISYIVYAITLLATGVSAYIIYTRARRYYPIVKAEMEARELEAAKLKEYSYREGERFSRDSESSMTLQEDVDGASGSGKGNKEGFYGNNFSSSEVTLHHSDNAMNEKLGGSFRNDSQEVLIKARRSSDDFVGDRDAKRGYEVNEWDNEHEFDGGKRKDSDVTVVGGSPSDRNETKYANGGL